VEIIQTQSEILKTRYNQPNYECEVKDCILWCLNNLNELIAQPSADLLTKMNKNELSEQRKKEYTVSLLFKFLANL
jgi:hypothetical protein